MTEDEARAWITERVSRETFAMLERLVEIVKAGSLEQNLIAASTIASIWDRHIVDSAQLLSLVPKAGRWIDLGSGAGFPGLVVALMGAQQITLAESRAKRVVFLRDAVARLGLASRVSIAAGRIERMAADNFDIISARAFAPLDRLFATSLHLAKPHTIWVLPKGRGAQAELDAARGSWQGDFRIVPSVTDPDAAIIVAEHVRPVRGRTAGSAR